MIIPEYPILGQTLLGVGWTQVVNIDPGKAALASTVTVANVSSRPVVDATLTAGSTTITSATADFETADVGRTVSGSGVQSGATITAVASATSATMSLPATVSGSNRTVTVGTEAPVDVMLALVPDGDTRGARHMVLPPVTVSPRDPLYLTLGWSVPGDATLWGRATVAGAVTVMASGTVLTPTVTA